MQEDWTQAIQSFRTFTQLKDIEEEVKLADAYSRIADAYYTREQPDFEKAAINYNLALEHASTQQDKILYALSKVYRLMSGKRDQQIEVLERLLRDYPHSTFYVASLFEIANSYKNAGNFTAAMANFEKILTDYPQNILVKDVLIEIAD